MPNCAKHNNQPIKLLCLQKMCYDRLACESCIAENHNRHDVIYISKQIKQFSNLHRNSDKPGAAEKKRELQFYFKELRQKSLEIEMEMKFWREETANIFFQDFQTLCETFSTQYIDWAWQILNSKKNSQSKEMNKISLSQNHLKQLDKIAKDILFTGNDIFDDPSNILKAAQVIYKEVSLELQNCRAQIHSAMMNLTKKMATLNFNNIEQILKNIKPENSIPLQRKRQNQNIQSGDIESADKIQKKRKICEKSGQKEMEEKNLISKEQSSKIGEKKQSSKSSDNQKENPLQKYKREMIKEVFGFMQNKEQQDQQRIN